MYSEDFQDMLESISQSISQITSLYSPVITEASTAIIESFEPIRKVQEELVQSLDLIHPVAVGLSDMADQVREIISLNQVNLQSLSDAISHIYEDLSEYETIPEEKQIELEEKTCELVQTMNDDNLLKEQNEILKQINLNLAELNKSDKLETADHIVSIVAGIITMILTILSYLSSQNVIYSKQADIENLNVYSIQISEIINELNDESAQTKSSNNE